jgi:hypothetical protein
VNQKYLCVGTGCSRVWLACLLFMLTSLSQAQQTYGSSDAPLVAEVGDVQIHTSNPDEMAYVIKQLLIKRYIEDQKLQATDAAIAEFLDRKKIMMESNRLRMETRHAEIQQALASETLTADARARLEKERDALYEMNRLMAAAEGRAGTEESDAAEAFVARAFIEQWKVNQALYRQYGGRVIFQQSGAEPLDAYRDFFRDAQKSGRFKILSKDMEPALWSYYTTDNIHVFYPESGNEKELAINTPWWMMDEPAQQ